jgi:hypothetical protein
MSVKTYKYNDKTQLTEHFNVSEFKCKCGGTHDTKLDTNLVNKLEKLYTALNCSKIIVNSGYRCATHDKNVGGTGVGQHVNGMAADIVCYDKNGAKISTKKVTCAAQDVGFTGIANIDRAYTAAHVDVRTSGKWYGDETVTTAYSVCSDFYSHWGLSKSDIYGTTATSSTTTYTVKSGDTLWNIAVKFLGSGSRYTEIMSLNNLSSTTIHSGQTLKIPER